MPIPCVKSSAPPPERPVARVVDLFCGLGGASEGVSQAGGDVVLAADFWDYALSVHEANHPSTKHILQDLKSADFTAWPEHELAVGGPSCKGFSLARGKERPHHKLMRALMWSVVSCAEVWREKVWIIENVPKLLDWHLFQTWKSAMKALGYSIRVYTLDAADFGVAQSRVRVFIVCTQTSEAPELCLDAWMRPRQGARGVIRWDEGRWSKIDKPGRSEKILAQVKRGRSELGCDRFVFPYYGSGSGLTGRCLDRPIGTIVAHDIWAIADGDRMRMVSPEEAREFMGFPDDYALHGTRRDKMRALGNAICPPVMRALTEAIAQQTGLINLKALA